MPPAPVEVYPLAIMTPTPGEPSQTFIQRHVNGLLPGKTIILAENHKDFWHSQAPVHYFNIFNRDHLTPISELLQRHRVRIMMGEFLDESLLWFKLAKRLGIKFYVHGHGYDVSEKLTEEKISAKYKVYKDADGIITINHSSAEKLAALDLPPEKIHVVPYGIPIPDVSSLSRNNSPLNLLAVGRMVDKKAPIMLLDAFRRALVDYPDMRLDYVGDGVLFEAAVDAAKAFEITEKVTFHGACENAKVIELLKNADIFIQHSVKSRSGDEEGFPVSIIEALAYKLPVISTRHSTIAEQVIDGHNGFLVDEFDTINMAERLVEIARNPAQRITFGAAGHQHFLDHFTWDTERARLMQIMNLEDMA